MGKLQTIAKDTAIYGLSSIIGRFLNYLLVPLYTAQLSAASGGYGIITNMYAYVALILVILTFGMETTFYILAVYFGSVGIVKTRHAVTCGLLADLAGIIAAIAIAYLFFQ